VPVLRAVSRHTNLGFAGHCLGHDPVIGRIRDVEIEVFRRRLHDGLVAQKPVDLDR
jgi:hypothetical protein